MCHIKYVSHRTSLGDQMKKNEIGRTRDKYGGDERCTQGCDGSLRERGLLEEISGDWRVMLKEIFTKWDRGMN